VVQCGANRPDSGKETTLLQIFSWWLLIQLLGLIALPLTYRLFKWLPGRGYAFAKPVGLLLTSYLLWLGTSLGYLRNTVGGALVAMALTAGISLAWYAGGRRRGRGAEPSLLRFLQEHGRLVLTVEILFTLGFLAWAGLRAYAPDKIMSSGGEKFMEIAFLNAILQSPTFPPRDPWLSGFAISYYYFGYVMMALMTQLSGVLPGVGFELYDALMFALTLIGAFGVVHSLVVGSGDDGQAQDYGLLGALFVAIMGNLEGLLEALYARGLLPDAFWRWIDIPDLMEAGQVTGSWYPGGGWWWWRASRVIRDRNLMGEPMGLNPIDEFPFFSFLLGDNHPHVLALPFVLLAVGLAFNVLRRQIRGAADCESAASLGERPGAAGSKGERPEAAGGAWWNPAAYALGGDWGLFGAYALGLGALGFLNTWDLPIYVVLVVLAYGVGRYARGNEALIETLQRAAVLGASLTLAGVLLYLPFYIGFSSQAGGVVPYLLAPTRLPQYLVMFGPFVFVAVGFLLARLVTARARHGVWGSLARWWGIVAATPVVLLGLAMGVVALSEPGRQIAQRLLADPRIQQAVGEAGLGAALKAIIAARLRDPWLFLTLSLLIAGGAVSALLPGKEQEEPSVEGGGAALRAADRGSAGSQGEKQGAAGRRVADCESAGSSGAGESGSARFASLLFLCGLGLTYVVEFFYLRDSFGVRMNTIFKFYYQAWVMLGCASAFGVWWILRGIDGRIGTAVQTGFTVGIALLTAAGLVYPLLASYSRVDGFRQSPNLNGAANIARNHPDDWAAIEWLRAHAEGVPVILETPGKSYDYEGRISAFTGYPAVLGWAVHESQWRGSYVEQGKREPDIATIYTAPGRQQVLDLLHKWEVDYVVVGPPERRYVGELCEAPERGCSGAQALQRLDRFLQPVFEQGQTTIYQVPAG
jgi:YYY domain-containing protein